MDYGVPSAQPTFTAMMCPADDFGQHIASRRIATIASRNPVNAVPKVGRRYVNEMLQRRKTR